MYAAFKKFGRRPSTYFKAAITAPIAPLQTPVQKAHLKAIVNRCQKILFLFICCLVVTNSVAIELIILCRGLIAAFFL